VKTDSPPGFPLGALLSFFGPFVAAASQAVTVPAWRSDASLRAVWGSGSFLQGAPSALLERLCAVLPLGPASTRGTWLVAVAAGLAGYFVYQLARDLADRHGGRSSLDAWLGLGAAWSSVLGLAWLTESVVMGGAAPAAAGALGLLVLSRRVPALSTRISQIAVGAAFGSLLAESAWSAAAVLAVVFVEPPRGVAKRTIAVVAASALGAWCLWLWPVLTRTGGPSSWTIDWGTAFPWQLGGLAGEVGIVFGLAALFGCAWGVTRPGSGVAGVVLVLVFDWCAPVAAQSELLTHDAGGSRAALHLVALGLWAALGSLGLRMLSEGAVALQLYGAPAVRPLSAVLGLTAALAGAEDARALTSELPLGGTQMFTDLTLETLPARALVLTHSTELSSRLLAAQAGHARPDVLIVPLEWLGEVRWMRSLVQAEPALRQLIRDLNVMGAPSEHALNLLADARPVFVEADDKWDRRLLEHVVPLPFLAGFSPHALGRSDRLAAFEARLSDLGQLRGTLGSGAATDRATSEVARLALTRLEAVLVKAGDKKIAALVGERLSAFDDVAKDVEQAGDPTLLARADVSTDAPK